MNRYFHKQNIVFQQMKIMKNIAYFYYNGFKTMTWGRNLWIIIIIKLFIMFAILKLFFFNDYLGSRFDNDQDKSDYVIEQLTKPNP